jgi:hypothetical protein
MGLVQRHESVDGLAQKRNQQKLVTIEITLRLKLICDRIIRRNHIAQPYILSVSRLTNHASRIF